MLIVAILLTFTAIAIPSLWASVEQARIAHAVADIRAIEAEITLYHATHDQFPHSLADIGRDTLLDPWGSPYFYFNHAAKKGNGQSRKDRFLVPLNSDYDLYSIGKDHQSSPATTAKPSQEDIIRASDGGYVGLASQF